LAGTDFDAAAHVGKAPTALLFVHELTRNVAPLITGLDQLGVEFAWTGLQTHTIRIAADRNEAEAAVKRSSTAMRLHRPMLVSTDGVDGPGGYASWWKRSPARCRATRPRCAKPWKSV
jgi:hypothetical protein